MSSIINFMRDLLDRYQKLRGSTRWSPKGSRNEFWDIIVLTACDAEQGRAFQTQIDQKKKHCEVPQADYIVVVDEGPFPGCKIGAGGSTFLVLEELYRRFPKADLDQKKVLLIHAGGWSQRLPSASVLGKLFMPLPVGFDGDWDMLDVKLAMYLPFIPLMQPGIFVTASDDLELFVLDSVPSVTDSSPSGFVALGHPSSLHIGTTHGVFVCEKSPANQGPVLLTCTKVLQKPSTEEMKEAGAVLEVSNGSKGDGSVQPEPTVISDSAYWMDMSVAQKLFEFYKKYGMPEVEVDCYGDFMRPLGKDADEKYIEKTKDEKMRSAQKALFDTLHDISIQVLFLPQSRFIHLGTMREYLDALVHDQQLQASFSINSTSMHSIVNEKSSVSPQSVLEYCYFLQPVQVEANCLLSNCSNESVCSWTNEELIVPCGSFMHTVVLSVNGERMFVTVFCGVADDIKALIPRNNVALLRIFGKAFSSFLTDLDEVLPADDSENVSLWTAKLFPVCKYPGQSFLKSLKIIHSVQDGSKIQNKSFRCMSFADVLRYKDVDGSLEYRERLRCRIPSPQAAAVNIVTAGIDAVKPEALMRKHVVLDAESTVRVFDFNEVERFAEKVEKNVYLFGAGKAALGMFEAIHDVLKDHVKGGLLIVPSEAEVQGLQAEKLERFTHWKESSISVLFAGKNNLPNEDSIRSSKIAIEFVSKVRHPDILLCVISGGASALLCAPIPPVTLQEKLWMIKTLASRAAPIQDLNVVRGHLSEIKGGNLARHISPEVHWASLILSDIIGDPLELIGGGPTVGGSFRNLDAVSVVKAYGAWDLAPESIREVLSRDDTALPSIPSVQANNILVGNNTLALNACKQAAVQLGYQTVFLTNRLQGNCRDVAADFVSFVKDIGRYRSGPTEEPPNFSYFPVDGIRSTTVDWHLPVCLVAGGETTVSVMGNGKGGRNQEMALSFAVQLYGLNGELDGSLEDLRGSFVSCGTDGQDNTDAAGAQVNFPFSAATAEDFAHAKRSLENNDSYSFFSTCQSFGTLLTTGLTGTNVMDLQVLLIS